MLNKYYKKNIVYPFWEYDNCIASITDKNKNKLTISENDRHPNDQGQVIISKLLSAALANVS